MSDSIKKTRVRHLEIKSKSKKYGMSVEEIAIILGCSHQRVTQILNEAIIKIRKNAKRHNLKYGDFI